MREQTTYRVALKMNDFQIVTGREVGIAVTHRLALRFFASDPIFAKFSAKKEW